VTQTKILTKEKKQRGWTLEGGLTMLALVLVAAYFVKKWIDKLIGVIIPFRGYIRPF
jgi:hypothetical protein